MSLGRLVWELRDSLVGPERVVTGDHVKALRRLRLLGVRSRAYVRTLHLRELAFGPAKNARVPVGDAIVELGSGHDFPIDWKAFTEIFGTLQYSARFRDARVLDVGAHKGYFGALALAEGATVVLSFEPALRNYEALERTAGRLGDRWHVRNAALGASEGHGTLLLDSTPWAHSLVEVERPAGEQIVSIVTLEQALAALPRRGSRTIVKVDAEGSECDILARSEALEPVDVLLVEWHSSARCTIEELKRTIESAGLVLTREVTGAMTFERRDVARRDMPQGG
jgi:FkbM family methyltransferase